MALGGRLGKYRLVRRLAVGGMAEVYLAVAEGLSGFEKRVVVKRLLPTHARDAERLAMFLDEARLVAALAHPNIAEVYDIGSDGGEYFIAMEHVAGRDLRDLLDARLPEPLPLPDALAVVVGVALGLHHAHEQRQEGGKLLDIVHRDVSPSNVLISTAGEVKLIDFGIAKWAAQRTETRHGILKGKSAYMSPEQCRAEPLDRRSDLFSLGVVLYEVTTGLRPFESESDFAIMTAIVRGTFNPPSMVMPGYPKPLEAIVLRALSPAREDRYPTARVFADDLTAFAAAAGWTLSPARLAALLAASFGAEAAGRADQGEGADEALITGTTAVAIADASMVTPPPAARTATDLSTVPARQGPLRRDGARVLRIGLLAGVGIAAAAAIVIASTRAAPPVPPVAPAPQAVTVAPAPSPVPPAAVPAPSPPPEPERVREPESPRPTHARTAHKKKVNKPPAPAPATVWNPDSPVLP